MEEKIFVKRKPRKCPICGFKPISTYQYGEPCYTFELIRDLENNKVVLGGCCISDVSPLWHCAKCNTDFHFQCDSSEEHFLKLEKTCL